MQDNGEPQYATFGAGGTTIEITFGVSERTSRVDLKKRMCVYGDVDVCHMGTRGQDHPFVRFRNPQGAEAALRALKNGEVFLDDGSMLAGDWKTGNKKPTPDQHQRQDQHVMRND